MKKNSKIKKICVVFIIVYVFYIVINQQIAIKNKRLQLEKYNAKLQDVTKEHQGLLDKSKMSETYRYVERLARERLGFIKQGENSVMKKK